MRIGVAASGGRDSTALLHCVWRAAAPLGVDVIALHVHHGLVDDADQWLERLRVQCRRWARRGGNLTFDMTRLQTTPAAGDSVEAWARRERYAALAAMARHHGCNLVLLAHHRRDQAETVLLQALRGAAAAGLAAMPARFERHGVQWARPWLHLPSSAIGAYVTRWRLSHSEDSSNEDPRYARNRLRNQVWSTLSAAFPHAEESLVQVAAHAAEAQAVSKAMAEIDARAAIDERGLEVSAWRRLPAFRQANLLRWWLRSVHAAPVPESLVQRLLRELALKGQGRWPWSTTHGLGLAQGYLQTIDLQTSAMAPPLAATGPHDLSACGDYRFISWQGVLRVLPSVEGLPADTLRAASLRTRRGGEQFRLQTNSANRSLKKQFQVSRVPAWERTGPLLYDQNDRLLFVPGLGIDARVCQRDEPGLLTLQWLPARASSMPVASG